jgi:EAL domain-containing protein (putative c-di-GMP-specific phosphodiesterase class I)
MSAAQLADRTFPETVREILVQTGIPAGNLCLEITERDALERSGRGKDRPVNASLAALREVGVQLAIDDFGTGYSSLTHLRQFPVDVLKVDRSFVNGMGRNRNDSSIVRAVVSLARAMDLTTVAEGVERRRARQLAAMGCDRAQGFLWGAPSPRPSSCLLPTRPPLTGAGTAGGRRACRSTVRPPEIFGGPPAGAERAVDRSPSSLRVIACSRRRRTRGSRQRCPPRAQLP